MTSPEFLNSDIVEVTIGKRVNIIKSYFINVIR